MYVYVYADKTNCTPYEWVSRKNIISFRDAVFSETKETRDAVDHDEKYEDADVLENNLG